MERDKVKEIIFDIIKPFKKDVSIEENPIKENYTLETDLGFDSLDFVEFIVFLEKEFNIAIPDDYMEEMYKLQLKDIINYIHKEVNK